MVISILIVLLITLAILGQIYFLGKYFSITQEIFTNKSFAAFTLGGAAYFTLSFIVIFPFSFLKLNITYYLILLAIKDIFTCIFLIGQRHHFKDMIINRVALVFIAIAGLSLPIIYKFIYVKLIDVRPVDYFTTSPWEIFKDSIQQLIFEKKNALSMSNYTIRTIVSTLLFSSISSLFLNFSKRESWKEYIITLILTYGLVVAVGFKLDILDMLGIFLIAFMFLSSYNLIMFSRRRYGTLFGILVFVLWSIQPNLFFAMLVLALATSIVYVVLRKPKAFLFTIQLFSPLAIVYAIKINTFSTPLALFISITGIISYLLIFVFGRMKFLDTDKKLFLIINKVFIGLLFGTLVITAITWGIISKVNADVIWKGNEWVNSYSSNAWGLTQNILYYVFLGVLISAVIIWKSQSYKFVKMRAVALMILFVMLIGYNPLFHTILLANNNKTDLFQYISIAFTVPAVVCTAAFIRTKIVIK